MIVDAGPLVAAASARDRHHDRCVELLSGAERPLLVPALVVTEVSYFLAERLGHVAERAFATSFERGELLVEPLAPADWTRIGELVDQYADLGLGIVDASVLAACERLEQKQLATLDHRHFGVVRPRHCPALTLLPAS